MRLQYIETTARLEVVIIKRVTTGIHGDSISRITSPSKYYIKRAIEH